VSIGNILDLVRAWADAELRGDVLTREQWLLAASTSARSPARSEKPSPPKP
jgi:hypothetical protein